MSANESERPFLAHSCSLLSSQLLSAGQLKERDARRAPSVFECEGAKNSTGEQGKEEILVNKITYAQNLLKSESEELTDHCVSSTLTHKAF